MASGRVDEGIGSDQHDDVELRQAIDELVGQLQPELVILFGSRARGTPSRRSDLDLFIVMETDEKPLARIGTVTRCLPSPAAYDIDVIVYRPVEFEERRDSPFIRRVLAEGIILYQRADAS